MGTKTKEIHLPDGVITNPGCTKPAICSRVSLVGLAELAEEMPVGLNMFKWSPCKTAIIKFGHVKMSDGSQQSAEKLRTSYPPAIKHVAINMCALWLCPPTGPTWLWVASAFFTFKTFVSPQNSWCSSLFMDIHPPNRRNRSSKSMIFLNMFNVLKTASHPHLHNSQHFTVHPQMSVWTSGFLVCWKVFTWIMQWKNGNWWWNCVPIGSDRLSPPMFRSHPSEHGPMDAHLHFAWQTQGARHYLSQQTKRCLQPATNGMNNSSLSQRDERNFQKLTCLK